MPYITAEVNKIKGFNSDLSPYELPADVWTRSDNTDNNQINTRRSLGVTQRYVDLKTEAGDDIKPLFALYWYDGTNDVYLFADENGIYKVDSDGNVTTMITGIQAQPLTGWTGNVFNGVAILNNGFEPPYYANSPTTAVPMSDIDGWESTDTCKVIRPYKNYLVALGYNGDTVIKWSSPADAGSMPSSWDETSLSAGAGTNVLPDTGGNLVDGKALGDSFIIYKEDSVYAMDFVGGTFIFSFRKLFNDNEGCLSKDCIAEFEGKHFVLGRGDAYIHDGTTKRSVMNNRVSDALYKTLDDVNWSKVKVVADTNNKNIWVYYPTQNNVWANKALIYNWASDSWSTKELLTDISYIATGVIDDSATDTWDSDLTGTWDEDTTFWDQNNKVVEVESLLLCDYENCKFLEAESGVTWDGQSYETIVEKVGVDFGDSTQWKRINTLYPSMTGSGTVDFYVGHQDPQGGTLSYEGPFSYTVGEDYKVNCRVNGRNIAIKMVSTSDDIWTFEGITIEFKPTKAKR